MSGVLNLDGKVALVTAAGRGIGRGIAIALAEAGAQLVINSFSESTTASLSRNAPNCVLVKPGCCPENSQAMVASGDTCAGQSMRRAAA